MVRSSTVICLAGLRYRTALFLSHGLILLRRLLISRTSDVTTIREPQLPRIHFHFVCPSLVCSAAKGAAGTFFVQGPCPSRFARGCLPRAWVACIQRLYHQLGPPHPCPHTAHLIRDSPAPFVYSADQIQGLPSSLLTCPVALTTQHTTSILFDAGLTSRACLPYSTTTTLTYPLCEL